MSLAKQDHIGKRVFVGIDVHKKTYAIVAVGDHMPNPIKFGNLRASPSELIEKLQLTFPGAILSTVYEAGFAGFHLHRSLVKSGINNIVINPASIEVAANNKVKTDKRDAAKMALHLSKNLLKAIRIPSEEEELERLYSRTREQLVRDRARTGVRLKAKLFQFGLMNPDDDRVMSGKLLRELLGLPMPEELNCVLKSLAAIYKDLSREIKVLEAKMKELAQKHSKIEDIYQSVPGVGFITSRVFAAELGDMSQFRSEKQLFSFLGLTPSEYSSGETERRGRITKQGNSSVRAMLIEVAWRAIGQDVGLRECYDRIKATRGGKRAIVAIARRLSGKMRRCLRTQQMYQIDSPRRATKLGTVTNHSQLGASTVESSPPIAARQRVGAAPYVEVS